MRNHIAQYFVDRDGMKTVLVDPPTGEFGDLTGWPIQIVTIEELKREFE